MSDLIPPSGKEKSKKKNKRPRSEEEKQERKRRKREKLLKLTEEQTNSSDQGKNTNAIVDKGEDDEERRRRKEKKRAKKLKKKKLADLSQEKAQGQQVPSGMESSELVRAALVESTDDVARRSSKKRNVQDLIDQALLRMVTGVQNRSASPKSQSTKENGGGVEDLTSSGGSQSIGTKEGTLEDAAQLSHKEMLVDRLYHSNQLKWLKEEVGLQYKTGKFSQGERVKIDESISAFKKEHRFSDEDFLIWLFNNQRGKDQKVLYADFWKTVTSSLADRPNRAVRLFVRRALQPSSQKGDWTSNECRKLERAVEENGTKWIPVSQAVGTRSAEDCRLRWRDHAPKVVEKKRRGSFTDEERGTLLATVRRVCKEAGVDLMSLDSKIPWQLVSEEMEGERTPNQCLVKWQHLRKALDLNTSAPGSVEPRMKWTNRDSQILVDRLSKEERALQTDDFTEVRPASLRSSDWAVEPHRIRERWKLLVHEHVSPDQDWKINFRSNLEKIKQALSSQSPKRARRLVHRQNRKSKDEVDLIDTDEEV